MSDKYEIGGVTITPGPGGYYELSHPSLSEPEKVRGKETADARAAEIAAAAQTPEGSMEPQPPIDQVTPGTGGADGAQQAAEQAKPSDMDAKFAALQGLVAQQSELIQKLLDRPVTTVTTEGETNPNALASMPREFKGQVDAKTRAAAKKLGVEYKTIVLEESPDIPPTGLFIGHNGNSFMIMPGEPVDVPDFLLGVLDDAVMASPQVDSSSKRVLGYRSKMRFPYRIVNDKEAASA